MTDEEWVILIVQKVASSIESGDGIRRFQAIEGARLEAEGSACRRMALLALETFIPKLDGEMTARRCSEQMLERFAAARVIIQGDVIVSAGSSFGDDNSTGKSVAATNNGQ